MQRDASQAYTCTCVCINMCISDVRPYSYRCSTDVGMGYIYAKTAVHRHTQ